MAAFCRPWRTTAIFRHGSDYGGELRLFAMRQRLSRGEKLQLFARHVWRTVAIVRPENSAQPWRRIAIFRHGRFFVDWGEQ